MPHRRHARPMPVSSRAASFLPPQPLADRDRHGLLARIGRRGVVLIALVVVIALAIPVAVAGLGPAGAPLAPLGGVAGAVSSSHEPTVDASQDPPASVPTTAVSIAAHRRDADGPRPYRDFGPPPIASLTGYQWPIKVGRITLPFKDIPGGTRIRDGRLMHDGVDMASFCGAPVGAAHAGVVLAAGRRFDREIGWLGDLTPYFHLLDVRHMWNDLPNVVVVDDGNGYRSIYAHFRDVTVKVGQHVKAGQLIGHEGATGHASGCHVHYGLFSMFETKKFGVRADILRRLRLPKYEIARIDPLQVLPGGDVALRTRLIAKAIKAAKAEAAKAEAAAG